MCVVRGNESTFEARLEWYNERMTFPPEKLSNEIMNKKQMSFTNMSEEQCLNKKKSFKLRK
jgi:hypothetical protein